MGLSKYGHPHRSAFVPQMKNGHWVSVQMPGLKKRKKSHYRGWEIEIIDRVVGLTVRRRQLSVLAQSEHPPFRFYRSFLHSEQMAEQVAKRFVDDWHEQNGHLMSLEELHELRKQRNAKKLYKMRTVKAKRRPRSSNEGEPEADA